MFLQYYTIIIAISYNASVQIYNYFNVILYKKKLNKWNSGLINKKLTLFSFILEKKMCYSFFFNIYKWILYTYSFHYDAGYKIYSLESLVYSSIFNINFLLTLLFKHFGKLIYYLPEEWKMLKISKLKHINNKYTYCIYNHSYIVWKNSWTGNGVLCTTIIIIYLKSS